MMNLNRVGQHENYAVATLTPEPSYALHDRAGIKKTCVEMDA
jgi:hypothetical protein